MPIPKIEIVISGIEVTAIRVDGEPLPGVRRVTINAPVRDYVTVNVEFILEELTVTYDPPRQPA